MEANQAPPAPETMTTTTAAPTDPDARPPLPADLMGAPVATSVGVDVSAPQPPALDEVGRPKIDAVGTGWMYNRLITHLWSYDAPTGVWVWVDGIGWKRLSPVSQFGHTHMTALSTVATDRNLPVSYHEDASGQIDQIMV